MKKMFIYGLLLTSNATYSADPSKDFLRLRILPSRAAFNAGIRIPEDLMKMPVQNKETLTGQHVIEWFETQDISTRYCFEQLVILGEDVDVTKTIESDRLDFNTQEGETSGVSVIVSKVKS
jgi:hypothetical protein